MNNSGTLNCVCCTIILFAHVRVDSTRPLSMNEGNNRTSKREKGGREEGNIWKQQHLVLDLAHMNDALRQFSALS